MIKTKLPLAFLGLIFFSVLSWHCTKIDTTNLGGDLIPAVDNVNTFDTIINVVANNIDFTVYPGKGCAVVYPTDEHALGYIGNDPYFGITKATIYTELKPAGYPFFFPVKASDITFDSVVLVLSYKRIYGDVKLQQRVEVHEIANPFKPDSSSCTFYPFKPAVLGSATYNPARLTDSVRALGDLSTNQLRIKISNSFAQDLLAKDTIKTDSAFKAFFNGFAIVPDNAGNALAYYSLTDGKTKLAIYYKYKRAGLTDTLGIANFSLYPGDKSANNIVRNHAGSELAQNLPNPAAGANFIYLQTTPGTFAELKIPGLTGLSNRIVHRAELIMEQVYSPASLDTLFAAPNFLFLDLKDTAIGGAYHPVPCDFNAANGQPDIGTYGGFKTYAKDASGNSIARYTFNISRYVQKIITNKKTIASLRLSAPEYVKTSAGYVDECNLFVPPLFFALNNVAMGRVKLAAGSAAANRIRLRIIYSNL